MSWRQFKLQASLYMQYKLFASTFP